MDYICYFGELLKSITGYKKIVILFLIKNDKDFLKECGFRKSDINRCLCLDFEIILIEQNEEYLDYIKNEEESIIERILNN